MVNTARNGVNEGAEPRRSTAIEPSQRGRPKTASPSDEHEKPRSYQRFVLTDPVAFRYLEEDPSTTVLARRRSLQGYECYIVEQWACSRSHPTFVITTFTGDPSHSVIVNVISVPTEEEAWSPALKVYFKALNQYHAKKRDTPLGTLMITNLSGFPSSLTVIPVPGGDVRKYREDFFVNENLKRLGCSGRLYRTSEKIDFASSVIELVKLCQIALMLFGKLEVEYADGLLCDVTEQSINDWWIELGSEYYNIEPHDGILGPTTVAALLGMLLGARNRLNAYGAPVSKDVFDIESTKRGIAYFQRAQRMGASRAVKSTMAELSGKGGEMLMDVVGARGKAGIAEIETTDIEVFVELLYGERCKWLWYGKPRKTGSGDTFDKLPTEEGLVFQKDDQGGYAWAGRRKDSTAVGTREDFLLHRRQTSNQQGPPEAVEKVQDPKRKLLKRATGKVAASGRTLKGAVNLRGHQHKHSKDDNTYVPGNVKRPLPRRTSTAPSSPTSPPVDRTSFEGSAYQSPTKRNAAVAPTFTKLLSQTPTESYTNLTPEKTEDDKNDKRPELRGTLTSSLQALSNPSTAKSSVAGSVYRGVDLDDLFGTAEEMSQPPAPLLRRTQSITEDTLRNLDTTELDRWPRHLSFSVAEDSVLTWNDRPGANEEEDTQSTDPKKQLTMELCLAEDARRAAASMSHVTSKLVPWTQRRIDTIRNLDAQADRNQQELEDLYYPLLDSYNSLSEESKEILAHERARLQTGIKEIEALGSKLEYEINVLRSKVEDVETGVEELGRQVVYIEGRVREVEGEGEGRGWWRWVTGGLIGVIGLEK
ncbi:hypothetical protein H2199_002394 [Coniosporium tulheliwenetii]|uniref:Uncharacterized protein n=1 Tax=Coniosporium tulheliwenetii TaxID=3383036 RepID=A0ACC2ZEZ3_9PEZI|nr:hypothetical protein H2199_002394 [Cladosporium sp. JES 115]